MKQNVQIREKERKWVAQATETSQENLDVAMLQAEFSACKRQLEECKGELDVLRAQANCAANQSPVSDLQAQMERLRRDFDVVYATLEETLRSRSWRWTAPLRQGMNALRAWRKMAYFKNGDAQRAIAKASVYQAWLKRNAPSPSELEEFGKRSEEFSWRPVISVIMPTFNTPKRYIDEAIESVRSQAYPYWELCIADDASTLPHVWETLERCASEDARVRVVRRKANGHISRASNSALELATGEYVGFLDHDDLLSRDALYQVALLLNLHPETDMIYSDEDQIDDQGLRRMPYFKPDWCPDSFLSRMYTCHLSVYRRSLVEKIGGFRTGYEGSQDYDLALRFTEMTDRIRHIPKILYHWRSHSQSTAAEWKVKSYALSAAQRAVEDALKRRDESGKATRSPGGMHLVVRYQIKRPGRVNVIIPTRDQGKVLNVCLNSIFERSSYEDFEVVVVDNGSVEPEALGLFDLWRRREPKRFQIVKMDIPFHYSKLNNEAVRISSGRYLLFLNNDTEIISADWIEAMMEQAQRLSVGAVGAKLLYPDNTIQHGGVIAGVGEVAGHSHRGFPRGAPGYFNQLMTVNNYSAVTGACMMCRRETYESVGGFDESLQVGFNDIDFCFKMLERGLRNVWLPHVVLYHHESKSRGMDDTPEKLLRAKRETDYMRSRWGHLIKTDPCYSQHLTRRYEDYRLEPVA
jgi:O-antigen biosynthesis protein